MNLEAFCEKNVADIDEESLAVNVLVFTFNSDSDLDFNSDEAPLGCPRYAEHTERLYRHDVKVKISSLLAQMALLL